MDFLPLFHRTQDKRCLIIGGGVVANRRAKVLVTAGLTIDVIAPEMSPELVSLATASGGKLVYEQFNQSDFVDESIWRQYFFVIAATDRRQVNAQVCELAKAHHILVNVVDASQDSDFIFPSLVTRDGITIAISNNGSSPVLSRLLQEKIDMYLPKKYGQLSSFVAQYRPRVNQALPDVKTRVRFWENVLQGEIAEHLFSGREDIANNALLTALDSAKTGITVGRVSLIDVSAGEVDLLTLRAFRRIQQAEVVVYDEFLATDIQALIKPSADCILVDMQLDNYIQLSTEQLINQVKKGKRVIRLFANNVNALQHEKDYIAALANVRSPLEIINGVSVN